MQMNVVDEDKPFLTTVADNHCWNIHEAELLKLTCQAGCLAPDQINKSDLYVPLTCILSSKY